MALQVWLPLTEDLTQQGLSGIEVTNNGAVVNNNGKLDKCYQFDGNDYITLPIKFLGPNYSYSAWVYTTSASATQTLGCCRAAVGSGFSIFLIGGKIRIDPGGNNIQWTTNYTYPINTWFHIVITCNNGEIKYYIDGEYKQEYNTTLNESQWGTLFSIGASQANGSNYGNYLTGRLNDVRIYDHCLSVKEIKELSKALVLHYKLDDSYIEEPIENLTKNTTYGVYNNFSSGGTTGTLTKLNETYQGCDVYRLTMTPNDASLAHFKGTLHSHGVQGFRRTFAASTKYCFWIYYRPVTHPDVRVGGTASNVGGWTEIPPQKYSNEWYVVGQYRNGSVTTDKTDPIYISFYTPTAEAGEPISIDFCCPHLIEGYDEIKDNGDYQGDLQTNIIFDNSGYENNGTLISAPISSTDSARYSKSISFDGTDDGILIENLQLSNIINSEVTYSFWIKPNGENSARSVYFGSYNGITWSIEKTTGNLLRLYWNGSPDETASGATITDNIWQHICITKKGTNDVKVYINGVQKWASTAAHNTLTFPTTYRIGRDTRSGDNTPYKGLMSDFRIYATALSAEDVAELYHTAASIDNHGNVYAGELKEV